MWGGAFMNKMSIQIDPMTYRRMTYRGKWQEKNKKYHEYMQEVSDSAREQGFELASSVEIQFQIPVRKSWSKKKQKEMIGKPQQVAPDLDNLVKAVLDALCYKKCNDSFVHTIKARKRWARTGKITIINRGGI